jgi:hypothetical protein
MSKTNDGHSADPFASLPAVATTHYANSDTVRWTDDNARTTVSVFVHDDSTTSLTIEAEPCKSRIFIPPHAIAAVRRALEFAERRSQERADERAATKRGSEVVETLTNTTGGDLLADALDRHTGTDSTAASDRHAA